MTQQQYRKIYVDGATALVLGERAGSHAFAMRASNIPIGVEFRDGGNTWGVFDLIRWEHVPECAQAGPDSMPAWGEGSMSDCC
jgi:hypothetical protein